MRNIYFAGLSLIILSLPAVLPAQELNLVVEPGMGTYRMTDLRELNRLTLNSLLFKAEQTDDFPSYWNYKSSLLFSMKRLVSFGVTFSHESTGARISRADYSGEYRFDTRIRAFSPGAVAEVWFPVNKFIIALSNEAGFEYSKLRLTEYFRVESESEQAAYTFTSKNFYYEPAIKLSYPVWLFRLGISAGYLFDLNRDALSGTDVNVKSIILSNGDKAVSDWSGVRIGASLSYNILRTKIE
ncbi:MAG TPA: hypothetical protein VK155_09830 [Bacteroidales bacterium]|nr:hypothetical protein [Bacteroidales bacterium]